MSDRGHPLRFGVFITPSAGDADRVVALAELADRAGLDLVTFQDHPYQSRFLDTWTLLSFVAARTERVALAGNVLNLPLRPPAVLARAVASARHPLSGGRAELGLGAGAFWDAIAAMGGRRRTPGESGRRAGGGDRRHPRPVGRRRGPRRPPRGAALPPGGREAAARRRPTTSGIWIGAYKPRMLDLVGPQGRRLAAEPAVPPARRPCSGQRGHRPRRPRGRPRPRGDPPPAERRSRPDARGPGAACHGGPHRHAHPDGRRRRVHRAARRGDRAGGAGARGRATGSRARPGGRRGRAGNGAAPPVAQGATEYERLGVTPTSDDRDDRDAARRLGRGLAAAPASPRAPSVTYTRRGRLVGQHLIDVHDMLRTELEQLRGILGRRCGRRDGRRRRPRRAQRDGAAPERLDARRVLPRYCARGRRPPHARGHADLPAPAAQRAGAGAGDRPAGGGAPRDPRRHPGRGRGARRTT